MKTRIVALVILALQPGLALAQGCHGDAPQTTAMSCVEGSVWNEAKGACVPQPSS